MGAKGVQKSGVSDQATAVEGGGVVSVWIYSE